MLTALSIRDIVLIEKLDVSLSAGLTVLTGETGAGKSILLDALGLALGARGTAMLVRDGAEQGVVTAAFDTGNDQRVRGLLSEQGLDADDGLVLRRVQSRDGPSRAFINDQPVSVSLLKRLGGLLTEIHGQHDDRALMEASGHRGLLDAFGNHRQLLERTASAWTTWQDALTAMKDHQALVAKSEAERDYLEHVARELEDLAPVAGEEEQLAAQRQMMMNSEQIAECVSEASAAIQAGGGFEADLGAALRKLERRREQAGGHLDEICEAIARVLSEAAEAQALLEQLGERLEYDPKELERTEERLFALKAAARKHAVQVDELPALAARFAADLSSITDGNERLEQLREAADGHGKAFHELAAELSKARVEAAERLDEAVARELPPLKLEQARFVTTVTSAAEFAGPHGCDKIEFKVSTNPGAPLQPLARVASGGELSRFMLALKAVLAASGSAPTLVFDEIDTGAGGAVADAIGKRLTGLAAGLQVLAITHSPQVAALAAQHLLISKMQEVGNAGARAVTRVSELRDDSRREEIARMLSAAEVTDEARAQADQLLLRTG